MNEFLNWFVRLFAEFKILTVVLPWERAARVRFGSRVTVWGPGWHFRIPFADEVVLLNTRLRVADTGSQTLTTSDGHTLTVGLSMGFRIDDPVKAMLRMHHPESSCAAIAASCVAGLASTSTRDALTVIAIESHVRDALAAETTYEFDFVRVRDFAYAPAVRLLNEVVNRWGAVHIEERKA